MQSIRLLVIGAHPDDCEQSVAGLALFLKEKGHEVRFLSVSDGCRGHYAIPERELAAIRRKEAEASGKLGGFEYDILDIEDCYVKADLQTRELITKKIREFSPNVIVTHRPNDYHPDHRNTSLLIQDSAYLLSVPHFVPEAKAMHELPLILYMHDNFQKPYPFNGNIVIDTEKYLHKKAEMISCHKSQFFDWLPWIGGYGNEVPESENARIEWMLKTVKENDGALAAKYAKEKGLSFAEAFEISEYGGDDILSDVISG